MILFPFYFVALLLLLICQLFYLSRIQRLFFITSHLLPFVLIMFLFSSHPAPLWFFWISMCGLFLTVCDLLQLLDSIHFWTKAQLSQLPQKMGLNSLQAYGGCAVWGSLHVFVGFVHISKTCIKKYPCHCRWARTWGQEPCCCLPACWYCLRRCLPWQPDLFLFQACA